MENRKIVTMSWKFVLMILCLFGFLKEFRPNEPFVTDQLTGPWKNFTKEQVSQDIYPVSIYSYFATLIIIFLLTDLLRYKPIVILCGLSGLVTFIMLIFGKTLVEMQILEFTYGLYMSTEVAYYTYIYAKVDKKHYEKVTGYTRAAFLVGKFLAGLVAQLTVSFAILDYYQLNYLTLAAQICATICALFLPSVTHSLYFHRNIDTATSRTEEIDSYTSEIQYSPSNNKLSFCTKLKNAYVYLWKDFLKAYRHTKVVKWSIWWALATCGYFQVLTYIQLLWQTAVEKDADIYNGAVEATYTIIGAVTVAGVGLLNINWTLYGESILTFFSIVEGLLLFVSCKSYNIWILYLCYIIFGIVYHTMITVASFEVAKRLSDDSYGLIFGINTFLALTIQSILTFVVVDNNFFKLNTRQQYFVYSCYYIALGLVFFIFALVIIIRHYKSRESLDILSRNTDCISKAGNNSESFGLQQNL